MLVFCLILWEDLEPELLIHKTKRHQCNTFCIRICIIDEDYSIYYLYLYHHQFETEYWIIDIPLTASTNEGPKFGHHCACKYPSNYLQ